MAAHHQQPLDAAMANHLSTSHLSSLSQTLVSLPQTLAASSSLLTKTLAGSTSQTLAGHSSETLIALSNPSPPLSCPATSSQTLAAPLKPYSHLTSRLKPVTSPLSETHEIRPPPLNFPRFNGQYPLLWIFQAQQFFDYHRTADDQQLRISSFYMDGDALSWFNDHAEFKDWSTFTRALEARFGLAASDDHQRTLAKLTQMRSLAPPPAVLPPVLAPPPTVLPLELHPLPLAVQCTPGVRTYFPKESKQRGCLPTVCGKFSVIFVHHFIESSNDSKMATVEFENMSYVKGLHHSYVDGFAKFMYSLGKDVLLRACVPYPNVHLMFVFEPQGLHAIACFAKRLYVRDDCIVVFDPGILQFVKLLAQEGFKSIFQNDASLLSAVITETVNVLCTIVPIVFVDRAGRKLLLLSACVLMLITQNMLFTFAVPHFLKNDRNELELAYLSGGDTRGEFCYNGFLLRAQVKGKIVVCDRGVNGRTEKGMIVKEAGGDAMILANAASNEEENSVDVHVLPVTLIGYRLCQAEKLHKLNEAANCLTYLQRNKSGAVKSANGRSVLFQRPQSSKPISS